MGNLCLTFCSKDVDEANDPIVGTWLLKEREDDRSTYYCMYQFRGNGTFAGKDWD